MPQRVDSSPETKKYKKCSSASQLPNANGGEEQDSLRGLTRRNRDETSHFELAMMAPNNQLGRDPREVLRASLEFQKLSGRELDQQRPKSRLPRRTGSESSLITATSSLYPSMESVNQAAADIDFEADWCNADVSERKTPAITSQSSTPLVQATRSNRIQTPMAASTAFAEAAAEVTIVECETIHPLEAESVVQAQLVNQEASCHELDQLSLTNHSQHQEATLGTLCNEANNNVSPFAPTSNNEVTTEATVIESGPLDKATIAAWSGDSTEVMAIPQESFVTPLGNIDDSGAKVSSLQNDSQVAVDTLSEGLSALNSAYGSEDADVNMVATVIDNGYDIHPSDTTDHSAQAELVPNSSANDLGSDGVNIISASNDSGDGNVATEATVLDCGPLDKATVDAWSAPEEAQVIPDDSGPSASVCIGDDEPKVPECTDASVQDVSASKDDQTDIQEIAPTDDNQAEIVQISDDFHPVELELESATTAQLIEIPAGILPDSGNVNGEHAISEIIVEDADQAPLTPAVESHNDIRNNVESQGRKPSGIIHEDEEIPLATIDGDRIQPAYPHHQSIDAQSSIANDPDNFESNAVLVSNQTSPIELEILGAFQEYFEGSQVPQPQPFASAATPSSTSNRTSTGSTRSSDKNRSDSTFRGVQALTKNISRGTNNVMEILFGDTNPCRTPVSFEMDSLTTSVSPRIPLPSSVIYSESTQSWVVTLSTSQMALDSRNREEASKALRAFEVPSEKQAICLAKAWAPPKMHPFDENPQCFICRSQFAVLRRASHCRNCGVCICTSCTVQWPSKMIPATYNIKCEVTVNVCKACDWLCSAFRLALLKGERDKAIALHATGNVNLTTPFANIKGEVFYPVHCAVLGRSLWLLKWLVDDNCCPLKSIRIGIGGKGYTPILTSKARSLLSIALTNNSIDIMRYLVAEKNMLLQEEKNLSMETLIQSIDSILRVLPVGDYDLETQHETLNEPQRSSCDNANIQASINGNTESTRIGNSFQSNNSLVTSSSNECILCCSNEIDCVVMPCGHQMCCMECSTNISRCPVCQSECSFVRVYRG